MWWLVAQVGSIPSREDKDGRDETALVYGRFGNRMKADFEHG